MNLLAIVLLVLLPLAAAQSSYPGCIAPSCTPLRNAALSTCGFDIAATLNATLVQTQCICNMNNLQSVMQSCVYTLPYSPLGRNFSKGGDDGDDDADAAAGIGAWSVCS